MHLVTFERSDARRIGNDTGSLGEAAMGFESLGFARPGLRRLGAVLRLGSYAGSVVDLNRALAIQLACDDVGAPEIEADSLIPPNMLAFLRLGPTALAAARRAVDFAIESLDRYSAPDFLRAGAVEAADRVKLCAPVPRPGKVLGASGNALADRVADTQDSARPRLFLKAPSAVIGPDSEIALPDSVQRARFGGALAAVIGAPLRNVDEAGALEGVVGYCAANDVSCPDFADESIGRSCDTFAPLGPWLVTKDEIDDPADLGIRSVVSGEVVRLWRAKELRFSIAQIIAHASAIMTLEPGDVILIGSPADADPSAEAKQWIRDGDLVEVEVEALGRLRNYVTSARSA